MIHDDLKLTGALTIALNDEIVQETENLVVTAGKNWVADRMNNANTVMTHMAVGTGTNAAAAGDTTLQTENDRNALTSSTVTNNAIAYVGATPYPDSFIEFYRQYQAIKYAVKLQRKRFVRLNLFNFLF